MLPDTRHWLFHVDDMWKEFAFPPTSNISMVIPLIFGRHFLVCEKQGVPLVGEVDVRAGEAVLRHCLLHPQCEPV
jgi:hypothetical protein